MNIWANIITFSDARVSSREGGLVQRIIIIWNTHDKYFDTQENDLARRGEIMVGKIRIQLGFGGIFESEAKNHDKTG